MNKLVTLRSFLKEYSITKEEFLKETNKDKAFYDKYIEWEQFDDATIISPKALSRLGEVFDKKEPKMTITYDGEVQQELDLTTEPEEKDEKPKRKRRTKKEMEEARKAEMSDFMAEPVTEEKKENKKPAAKPAQTKKKRSKNNITKAFIQEHGQFDTSSGMEMKDIRKFMIGSGLYKIEQVAMMSDKEAVESIKKDYYFISSPEGTYIIKRNALTGIMSDVYVIEKQ